MSECCCALDWQGESDTDTIEAVNGFPAKLKEVLTTFWYVCDKHCKRCQAPLTLGILSCDIPGAMQAPDWFPTRLHHSTGKIWPMSACFNDAFWLRRCGMCSGAFLSNIHSKHEHWQVLVTCREMESTQYLAQLRQAQLEVGTSMHTPQVWTVDAKGLELKVSILSQSFN